MALDNIDEIKESVQESKDSQTSSSETTLRLDRGVVSDVKSELGVSRNTELAPFVESAILEAVGEEERANEKLEEFKQQFED